MARAGAADFLAGVIEGFYGKPWTNAERFGLFERMAGWGLNTYVYAPKDDLRHRSLWREIYPTAESESLGQLVKACTERGLAFVYALGPGLDIRYSDETELDRLRARFGQLLSLGCRHFALLFDDIPDRLEPADLQRWGSFASAQCAVTNELFRWTRGQGAGGRFLFCPTPYCGRMAERRLGGEDYLATVGRELAPGIDVFWTGPEIISREIPTGHLRELQAVLGRKPVLWDNLHANDYDGRRFYCGPYTGRPPEVRAEVRGILSNPNNELPLNHVPLWTLARFVALPAGGSWDPRAAYLAGLAEWLPQFAAVGGPVAFEDLVLLGDCHYLPHEEGPEAEALYELARSLVQAAAAPDPDRVAEFRRLAGRLRECCARMTELRDRPLFYALSRRLWELREELDLLERYVTARVEAGAAAECRSDFHLPGTYRGGLVPRLQRLLVQEPDGTFTPARPSNHPPLSR